MDVRVELLGAPRVRIDGDESLLPATLPGALLAYLAARGGWVGREELAFVFRPDVPDAEARRGLRKLVFRARSLPFADAVEVVGDRLRWSVPCDLVELRLALRDGRVADAAGIAFAPPFDGYAPGTAPGFDAWMELERAEATALWRRACLEHAHALERHDAAEAVRVLERLAAHDPVDETVVQELMRLLAETGERGRALAWFDAFAARLEADLGVAPLEATLALADDLRQREIEPVPRAGHRLTRPTTPLVGRDDELARAESLLQAPGAPLVSIVGLGGVGKTRLALALLDRLATRTGSHAVELSVASFAGRPPVAALAAAWDVRGEDPVDVRRRLHARLARAETVLLLDEVDAGDVAAIAAEIAALRQVAPGLRVVTTSRRPLGLVHEHTLGVDGLPIADGDDPEAQRASPAVALFLARAARVAPELVDDDATVRAAAAACRALGGHPLAIELAAAWTRTLPVAGIAEALAGGQDLLRTTAPDVPERHRSVRTLVARAWADLDEGLARPLLALLAFRSHWTLAAAAEVAGADVGTVVELVSRSLVRRVGADRFEVHELVRSGAPADVPSDALDRHARWTLAGFVERRSQLRGGDQGALVQAEGSIADLRAAWARAVQVGAVDALDASLEGIDALVTARNLTALADELYRPAADALERVCGGGEAPQHADVVVSRASRDHLRARLLVRAALRERHRGATDAARATVHDAIATAPAGTRAAREAHLELAIVDDAVHAFPAALSGFRSLLAELAPGDDDLAACAHAGVANVMFATGDDPAAAMRHAEEGLRRARRSGDVDLIGIALVNLGAGHYDVGSVGAAERCWREAAGIAASVGNRWREALIQNNLAAVAERRGDAASAEAAYRRSLEVRRDLGDERGVGRVLLHLGRLALAAGRLGEADEHVEAAALIYERTDAPADLAWAVATHARVRLELGDDAGAARRIERALRLGRLAGDEVALLAGLLATAGLRVRLGHTEAAVTLARQVATLAAGRVDGVRASAEELVASTLGPGAERWRPQPVPERERRERIDALVQDALEVVAKPLSDREPFATPGTWNGGGTRRA